MVLLKLGPTPPTPPEGSPVAMFMGAMFPTGYLTFVKVLEVLGGVLVIVPMTRNVGLLILGPIIVNIVAFHVFLSKTPFEPVVLALCGLALFLVWVNRAAFLAFARNKPATSEL